MGSLFSSSKAKKTAKPKGTVSAADRAVLDLKNSRDKLSRYRSKLTADQQKLLQRAKKCNDAGDKRMALQLLKLRKHKMNEAANVENQLLNVLQMVDTIETKENEVDMLKAMKNGKDALQALHEEMSIDAVLDLMDEVHEQGKVEEEISSILGEGAQLSAVDEGEVEAELAELEKEMNAGAASTLEAQLPEVPTGELPKLPEKEKVEPVSTKEKIAVLAS